MRKGKSKKYGQFLGFVLSFSALIHPAAGMDWSDVFNPDDHGDQALGAVGRKVLSLLDDRSQGRAMQVNKQWHQLVQHIRNLENPFVYSLPGPLSRPQRKLTKDILKSLKALKDPFTSIIQEIREGLFTATLTTLTPQQQRDIKSKLPNLMDSSLSLYPWHLLRDETSLKIAPAHSLNSTHSGFRRLNEVRVLLNTFADSFPSLASPLRLLEKTYKAYIKGVCTRAPEAREALLSPIFLHGDFLKGSHLISKSTAYQLLSIGELGIPEKKNATGSSIVTHVGSIYAKQNLMRARKKEETPTGTLDPGMEWAMSSFHRLLFGKGLVPSSLLALSSVPVDEALSSTIQEKKKNLTEEARDPNTAGTNRKILLDRLHEDLLFKNTKNYVLQVTPEISGEFLGTFLEKALKSPALFDELDQPQVQALILSALLTHPADAKGDNYIVTLRDTRGKRQIISIDNDLNLASMVIKEKEGFHSLETRNILFCIPHFMDQTIDLDLRKQFLAYNPESFCLRWLKSLVHHNEQYKALLLLIDPQATGHSQEELPDTTVGPWTLINSTGSSSSTPPALLKLPLKLKEGIANALIHRFYHLQNALRQNDITLQQLFKAMDPLAALYTKRILEKESSPLKAFDRIYKQEWSFEKIFKLEGVLSNGKKVGNILEQENALKDAYKERSQSIEESVKELLKKVDLFHLPNLGAFLTTAIEGFGDLIKTSGVSFLHDSWFRDGLLLKAASAKIPEAVLKFLLARGLDGRETDADRKTAKLKRHSIKIKTLASKEVLPIDKNKKEEEDKKEDQTLIKTNEKGKLDFYWQNDEQVRFSEQLPLEQFNLLVKKYQHTSCNKESINFYIQFFLSSSLQEYSNNT